MYGSIRIVNYPFHLGSIMTRINLGNYIHFSELSNLMIVPLLFLQIKILFTFNMFLKWEDLKTLS